MNHYDYLAKILIVGNSGVGKTNLLLKFCQNQFTLSHITTIGIDFKVKNIVVDGKIVRMQIWDTAGQQRFKNITQSYYKGAHAIIMTYSIDDDQSFNCLQNWLKQIRQFSSQNIIKVVVATKCDLPEQQRKVSSEEGIKFSKKYGLQFFQVSAKNGKNVQNLFLHLGKMTKKTLQQNKSHSHSIQQIRISSKINQSIFRPMQKDKNYCNC